MKKLLPIILLLVFSCDEVLESIKEGCTTTTSCNYDVTAMKDDGSCVAPQGCNEWCEGDSLTVQELDCADVCGGNTTQAVCDECPSLVFDCAGTCDGSAVVGGCDNTCGSTAVVDECGVCDGDNSTCLDWRSIEYPWAGYPLGSSDGKDNNPWNHPGGTVLTGTNNSGIEVRIGNGEAMDTGDPDGDGVMGEDWYNGYDDDGDGLIDEDYFIANGKDDGGIPCSGDSNDDGCYCCAGDYGVDEGIDMIYDIYIDGYDNDGNGLIDDAGESVILNLDAHLFKWGYNIEYNNIHIRDGRAVLEIHGQPNPWYIEGITFWNKDLKGDFKYDYSLNLPIFDTYIYDFGEDGIPGDLFTDESGDRKFQFGECLSIFDGFTSYCDVGLDGLPNTNDFGEGDGMWQPGDGWIDDGDGFVDLGSLTDPQDTYITPNENNYNDVWPPPNGVWDEGEAILGDFGQDGIPSTGDPGEGDGQLVAMDGFKGDPFDDLNGNGLRDGNEPFFDIDYNGIYTYPNGEFDGVFDTGDGIYGFEGETFVDINMNGIWDQGESFVEENGDNMYTPPDYRKNWHNMVPPP